MTKERMLTEMVFATGLSFTEENIAEWCKANSKVYIQELYQSYKNGNREAQGLLQELHLLH